MTLIPSNKLSHFFQQKGFKPTHLLGTTYTLSLAFFEGVVWPQLQTKDLHRCLILCDKVGFQRAAAEATAVRNAGRDYMVVCVPHKHSFHPKVWLMVGKDKAALLVGSGNLTQSGFMDNVELFDVVLFDEDTPRSLPGEVVVFLDGLQELLGIKVRQRLVTESLREITESFVRATSSVSESGSSDRHLQFVTSFAGPIADQLQNVGAVEQLTVAAPYFANSTSGLELLLEKLTPQSCHVMPSLHQGEDLDIDIGTLTQFPSVKTSLHEAVELERFCHFKLYGLRTPDASWLYTTSANCTRSALSGQNVEAGLLRRVDDEIHDVYFQTASDRPLPSGVRSNDWESTSGWISLLATDEGSRIDIEVTSIERLPVHDVTLTFSSNGNEATIGPLELLETPILPVKWSEIALPDIRNKRAAVFVRLEGSDSKEDPVRGHSFVEDVAMLSSDPLQRRAMRASNAMLHGDGVADATDIAAIFSLLGNVFEPNEISETLSKKKGTEKTESVDRRAAWPPVAADVAANPFTALSGSHNVQCFAHIYRQLFSVPGDNSQQARVVQESDADDVESAGQAAEGKRVAKVAIRAWEKAERDYRKWDKKLRCSIIDSRIAHSIWPGMTSGTMFRLNTLATAREKNPDAENKVELPDGVASLTDFLSLMFLNRPQPRKTNANHGRYGSLIYPPVACDLMQTAGVQVPEDMAPLIYLMFAVWKATPNTSETQVAAAFVRFLRVHVQSRVEIHEEFLAYRFERFFEGAFPELTWPAVVPVLRGLRNFEVTDHAGFRKAREWCHSIRSGAGEASFRFAVKRHVAGQHWLFAIASTSTTCGNSRCSAYSVAEQKIAESIAVMDPCVCPGCGCILIPEEFEQAFEVEA